ncbi:MAG TPA: hypothetical protein VFH85_03995 [Gammaproteobacteria bacterium]|nr:hypothetical protein [Gammaproteobacteria bacterium]
MSFKIKQIFVSDPERYEGVPRINIYLMRLFWLLIVVLLGRDIWPGIISHRGQWDPYEAVAACVWAGYCSLAVLGIFHPVRMIPLLFLEIFYKTLWLGIVAYPLWASGQLAGSSAASFVFAFWFGASLAIIIVPWPWVFRTYLFGWKRRPRRRESVATHAQQGT